jgi:hypothetical protein
MMQIALKLLKYLGMKDMVLVGEHLAEVHWHFKGRRRKAVTVDFKRMERICSIFALPLLLCPLYIREGTQKWHEEQSEIEACSYKRLDWNAT